MNRNTPKETTKMKNQTVIEFVDQYMKNEITIKKVNLSLTELIKQKEIEYDLNNPKNDNLTICENKNGLSAIEQAEQNYFDNDFECNERLREKTNNPFLGL